MRIIHAVGVRNISSDAHWLVGIFFEKTCLDGSQNAKCTFKCSGVKIIQNIIEFLPAYPLISAKGQVSGCVSIASGSGAKGRLVVAGVIQEGIWRR